MFRLHRNQPTYCTLVYHVNIVRFKLHAKYFASAHDPIHKVPFTFRADKTCARSMYNVQCIDQQIPEILKSKVLSRQKNVRRKT